MTEQSLLSSPEATLVNTMRAVLAKSEAAADTYFLGLVGWVEPPDPITCWQTSQEAAASIVDECAPGHPETRGLKLLASDAFSLRLAMLTASQGGEA